MIQSPITAFPAWGRACLAQPVAQPTGPDGGFGDWVDPVMPDAALSNETPLAEVEIPVDEQTGDDPDDLAANVAEFGLIRVEPMPLTGLPQVAMGEADDETAEPKANVAVTIPTLGVAGRSGEVAQAPEGDGDAREATQLARPIPDSTPPAEAPGPARPAAPAPDAIAQAVHVAPAQSSAETASAPAFRPSQVPPPIARQVADAVVRMDGDLTEITLAPEELGSVRIALSRDTNGLVVMLTAERPEALDLLRRHMDLLRQELATQGEDGVRLDFSAQGDSFAQSEGGDNSRAISLSAQQADAPDRGAAMVRPSLPGRIDMRI